MNSFVNFFRLIDNTKEPNTLLTNLLNHQFEFNYSNEQFLSAICQLILHVNFIKTDSSILNDIKNDTIQNIANFFLEIAINNTSNSNHIFFKLYHRIDLSENEIQIIVDKSLDPILNSLELTIILNLIKSRGLSTQNTRSLSVKMANSGNIFDYRNHNYLNRKKCIRRYPTGAVSEKIALIMPSLLMSLSQKYNFVSPFLVAKSLSYTGGTWDKLSSIPEFRFPNPGEDTLHLLKKGNVCMIVTKEDYNPSDFFLYQLRSITNTVNSLPLIISSIASKQIANPVDTLLLDIRFGQNTFIPDKDQAIIFYNQIKYILNYYNIDTISEFTATNQLHGSSIGNYLEVIESICIMKNSNSYDNIEFDSQLLEEQKQLAILMAAKLISTQFNVEFENVKIDCINHFNNLDVFESFLNLLELHYVKNETILKIRDSISFGNFNKLNEYNILAYKTGIIQEIYQTNIGNFINLGLRNNSNLFANEENLYEGVLIKTKQYAQVTKDEIIGSVFSQHPLETNSISPNFFRID